MTISREDVLRVAELAHLELTEEELDTYRGQLNSILSYIDKLRALDTSSVEPMAQILHDAPGAESDSLRDDVVKPDASGPEILRQAPDAIPGWFRVPRVMER
jgi:aspartyl-tRNA(Asn)/glutamyl-tRNA(Gln) amidotransferase subunit C